MLFGSSDVTTKVHKIVKRTLPKRLASLTLAASTDLRDDLHLDSMALLTMALHVEEAFGIDVASHAERMQQIKTVGDVVAFVEETKSARASA